MPFRWLTLRVLLGLVIAVGPSCGPSPVVCNASTCAGCCSSGGTCEARQVAAGDGGDDAGSDVGTADGGVDGGPGDAGTDAGVGGGGDAGPDLQWTNWPVPADSPASTSYTTTTDTVTDTVTGLMWQRSAPATTSTWADALNHCSRLLLGGFSDWRLPTLIELESIVNYGRWNPAIDPTVFPDALAAGFWSWSPYHSEAGGLPFDAWVVFFLTGYSAPMNVTVDYHVRCVRAVDPLVSSSRVGAPPGRYVMTTSTVFDTRTNLTWQRIAPTDSYLQADAAAYCQGLTLAQTTGWRLPTIKELQSTVDVRASSPAVDGAAFPATPNWYFWSSSRNAGTTPNVWVLNAATGTTNTVSSSFFGDVRCVR